jgi:membrane-associated protease RseP (regulator of RpoE activity)
MTPCTSLALRLAPLALALGYGLAVPAMAQDDSAARQKQLEQARADLQDAARRVAELSGATAADDGHIKSIRIATAEAGGTSGRPRLGVLLAVDEQAGVRIAGVTPGSGAEKAGLKTGDRLLKIDGKTVGGSSGEARVEAAGKALLSTLEPGKPVRIAYQRYGSQHEVAVTPSATQSLVFTRMLPAGGDLAAFPELAGSPELAWFKGPGPQLHGEVMRLSRRDCHGEDCGAPLLAEALRWDGLNLLALEPQLGRYFGTDRGVLVLSQGALPGLQAGDVIQKIEGKPVASPSEAMQAMTAKKPGEQARFTVLRERSTRELQVAVPERKRSLEFIRVPAAPAPPADPARPAPAAPVAPASPSPAAVAPASAGTALL